jgi:hypothetical protein
MASVIKVDQIQSDTGTVNQTSNLSFTGTGRRITGDFSNATISNRVALQTSVANSSSIVGVLPNGTSGISSLRVYQNSDPTNASYGEILANGTDSIAIRSLRHGTGTYLPMTFVTGGSERLRIPADAGGITFPATQAASSDPNTLDDYEEGTWTPAITGLTLGNASGQNFSYTKIGNVVTVTIAFVWGSTTSSSGQWEFSVPFVVSSAGGGAAYALDSGTAEYMLAAGIAPVSFAGIRISDGTGAGFVNNTAPFTWTTNDRFTCCVTYRAD